jgi:hypothetical protein
MMSERAVLIAFLVSLGVALFVLAIGLLRSARKSREQEEWEQHLATLPNVDQDPL